MSKSFSVEQVYDPRRVPQEEQRNRFECKVSAELGKIIASEVLPEQPVLLLRHTHVILADPPDSYLDEWIATIEIEKIPQDRIVKEDQKPKKKGRHNAKNSSRS